jgi:hypothetical protein
MIDVVSNDRFKSNDILVDIEIFIEIDIFKKGSFRQKFLF